MSPGKAQRKGITFMELLKTFPDHATAEAWFVETRWPEGAHCGSANVKTGANTNLDSLEGMSPRACADGSDAFGLGGELIPGQGAVVEDVLVTLEDAIGEPVVP